MLAATDINQGTTVFLDAECQNDTLSIYFMDEVNYQMD